MNMLKCVVFDYSENEFLNKYSGKELDIVRANLVLKEAARSLPNIPNSGYDKTFLKLKFEDGAIYDMRLDITKKTSEKAFPINQAFKTSIKFWSQYDTETEKHCQSFVNSDVYQENING